MNRPVCTDCGWRPAVSSISGAGKTIYLCSVCPSGPWLTELRRLGSVEPDGPRELEIEEEEEEEAVP